MLDELQSWWQSLTPEVQTLLQDGSLVVVALLGGHFLAAMVARFLRVRNFDAVLRLPASSPPNPETESGFTPTMLGGLLVRLTVWGGAACWLAREHDRVELANTVALILSRTWALATVLVTALALASLVARRVIDCLGGFPKAGAESPASRNEVAAPRRNAAAVVATSIYGLVVLFVLLIAADMFNWPLTRNSAQALWQLAHNLMIAGAALLVGYLGARWARELATPEANASPEKRAGQYTALGIVAATTVLAVAVLLASANLLIGLAAVAILGFLLWLVRGYLPDVLAGLQMRSQHIAEVSLDGMLWQVAEIGFLTTEVRRAGASCRYQNRFVLDARLHGAPAEVSQR